jgi:hypothetical protein
MLMSKAKPKTSEEIKEFWRSLPRGRRIVAMVGGFGWVTCAAAMGLAYKLDAGFEAFLGLAFLLFLCLFHGKYALEKDLTQRRVRKIDYWYLGAATIGLFLATFSYSTQRSETIVRLSQTMYEAGEQPLLAAVREQIVGLTKFVCVDLKTAKDACVGIKRIAAKIRPGLSAKQIAAISDEYLQKVTVPYALSLPPELAKDQNRLLPVVLPAVEMDRWREYAELAPNARSSPSESDEESEVVFDFGERVIWPFLLAFALALRITKVTIDVFEWAK